MNLYKSVSFDRMNKTSLDSTLYNNMKRLNVEIDPLLLKALKAMALKLDITLKDMLTEIFIYELDEKNPNRRFK